MQCFTISKLLISGPLLVRTKRVWKGERRHQYLIKHFADKADNKSSEFYTPAEVVRLLVQILKPEADNEIYDPPIGLGCFLIQSHQYFKEQEQVPNDLAIYGQGCNRTA